MERVSEEAFYSRKPITEIDQSTIEVLLNEMEGTPRKRIRLCLHDDVGNPLHEMAIVLGRESYIRPHKHEGKTESFHIIEGRLSVVFFDDDGKVQKVLRMGPLHSGLTFFYRLSTTCFRRRTGVHTDPSMRRPMAHSIPETRNTPNGLETETEVRKKTTIAPGSRD